MTWQPPPGEEWYYSIKSPSDQPFTLSSLLKDPHQGDRSFGRSKLPRAPFEKALRDEFTTRDGKTAIPPHQIDQEWISYQVWEPKEEVANDKDLLFIHGYNDYGGKFATHARAFLDAGYRVIVPDLPSHGRSSGVHSYLPDMEKLADAVYLVLSDVLLHDSKSFKPVSSSSSTFTQTRKVFIGGQSMGGFAAVLTCLKYGSTPSTSTLSPPPKVEFTPKISGGLFLCPMLAISPNSRPAYPVELLARAISSFAGTLPLASANKGKNSEDPTIEIEFDLDPQTYHGKLRVGTGLAVLKGLLLVDSLLPSLTLPFKVSHGTGDRVTSYRGSEKLFKEAKSEDKEIQLYDGFEHVMLRKGKDEKDDERRQRVLKDMLEWLGRH